MPEEAIYRKPFKVHLTYQSRSKLKNQDLLWGLQSCSSCNKAPRLRQESRVPPECLQTIGQFKEWSLCPPRSSRACAWEPPSEVLHTHHVFLTPQIRFWCLLQPVDAVKTVSKDVLYLVLQLLARLTGCRSWAHDASFPKVRTFTISMTLLWLCKFHSSHNLQCIGRVGFQGSLKKTQAQILLFHCLFQVHLGDLEALHRKQA